jgi:hypothetical protein
VVEKSEKRSHDGAKKKESKMATKNLMNYNDTAVDAICAAKVSAEWDEKDVCAAIPDGCVGGCWMVLNFSRSEAIVLWLNGTRDEMGWVNFEEAGSAEWDGEEVWAQVCRDYLNAGGDIPKGANFPEAALT